MLNHDYFSNSSHLTRDKRLEHKHKQKLEQTGLYETAKLFFSGNLFLDRKSISLRSRATADQRRRCNHFYVQCKWAEIFIWVFESVHIVQIISVHNKKKSHMHLKGRNRHAFNHQKELTEEKKTQLMRLHTSFCGARLAVVAKGEPIWSRCLCEKWQ